METPDIETKKAEENAPDLVKYETPFIENLSHAPELAQNEGTRETTLAMFSIGLCFALHGFGPYRLNDIKRRVDVAANNFNTSIVGSKLVFP